MHPRIGWSTCLALCSLLGAQARPTDDPVHLSGFGTLGLTWNSTNQAIFLRDLSQPDGATRHPDARVDSRLGLQADVALTDALRATVQVVSRYRYDRTFTPDFSWAFLAWNPAPEVQLRLGRLGVEVLMNADSRDVGYSYLWVRPPVECLGLVPITMVNGADATWTLPVDGPASLRLKAFFGEPRDQLPVTSGGVLNLRGDRLGGLITELEREPWRVRLAYARFQARREFGYPLSEVREDLADYAAVLGDPGLAQSADSLRFAGGTIQWYAGGLDFEQGPYQAQAMLNRVRSDRTMFPSYWSGYLSLGRRFGAWVPYLVGSRVASNHPPVPYLGALPTLGDPDAALLAETVQAFAASNPTDQSTLAAGVRWDATSGVAVKGQVDRVLSHVPDTILNQVDPTWGGRATVVTVTVDFVF